MVRAIDFSRPFGAPQTIKIDDLSLITGNNAQECALRIMQRGQDIEPIAIVPTLPFTKLHYYIEEGGLCEGLEQVFKLGRLHQIKQLGFLTQPLYNRFEARVGSLGEHTRYIHSCDVHAVGAAMGHHIALGAQEMNELRTICFTHDALTPAGGDSVKLVDPDAFDEDKNYHTLLDSSGFAALARRFDLRKDHLLAGIRNEGRIGILLDIADKIAYTARDLERCLHHVEAGAYWKIEGFEQMLRLIDVQPCFAALWKDVDLQDDEVVFCDPHHLFAFLKMRVLMFREFYYSPTARFGEFMISRLFVKILYRRGVLTREKLLKIGDSELHRVIDEAFGGGYVISTCESDLARCRTFDTAEEGRAYIDELREGGNVFAMMDDNRRAIKTAGHFKVWTKHGPRSLREAYPELAAELAEMAALRPLVHVYYLDGEPMLGRDVLAQLKKELA